MVSMKLVTAVDYFAGFQFITCY